MNAGMAGVLIHLWNVAVVQAVIRNATLGI